MRLPAGEAVGDLVAVEEPLEIRVEGESFAITMRTPGEDRELVAGFLFGEGCIEDVDDIAALGSCGENAVELRFASGVTLDRERLHSAQRARYASSACGVCSRATIEHLLNDLPSLEPSPLLSEELLWRLPEIMERAQRSFASTGGIHAAALVTREGELEVLREDIGRHNAVDKVIGWRLLNDALPVTDRVLIISGRAGFEVVQKAIVAGVGAMVSIGAPSSLAVELARSAGLQLYGFLKSSGCNRYSPAPTPEEL